MTTARWTLWAIPMIGERRPGSSGRPRRTEKAVAPMAAFDVPSIGDAVGLRPVTCGCRHTQDLIKTVIMMVTTTPIRTLNQHLFICHLLRLTP